MVVPAPEGNIELSVVIPLYNEEDGIVPLIERLDATISSFGRSVEVLFIDDGSTDRTGALLRLNRRSWSRILRLRRNFGQTQAMSAGFDHARGDVIVCMDGDLQNDPADIPRLLAKLDEGYDIVSGWRRDRKDRTFTRKIPSRAANFLIAVVTGVRLHDFGCTLKAYRRSVVTDLHLYSDMHRFVPALATRRGARVAELVVAHHPRRFGRSKYGLSRVFKVAFDLLVVKLIVTFSSRPAHYFGMLSLGFLGLFAVATFFYGLNLMKGYRGYNVVPPTLMILFLSSFLYFLFLGLLAEMILRSSPQGSKDAVRDASVQLL